MTIINTVLALPIWQEVYLGNTVRAYVVAVGVFVVVSLVLFFVRRVVMVRLRKLAERTDGMLDNRVMAAVQSIRRPVYYLVALALALQILAVHPFISKLLFAIVAIAIMFYVVRIVGVFIDFVAQREMGGDGDEHTKAAVSLLSSVAKVAVWVIGGLLVVSNLGMDVTSLIAGLGIGGIAIALALQGVLKDIFASFSLFFDKPFTIGDFIDADGQKGTVQKIGIKTTRLKALSGEEIVVPNQDLTSARVHNYKQMSRRRISFKIGVTYETPTEKLHKIAQMIEDIIAQTEHTEFSRVHFKSFDDWALTFEIVYFIDSRNYVTYMDAQQQINFGIRDAFEKENIDMAYPTKMVYSKQV